ncbi:hypothetical protein [Saccharopolyspora pogona]|uniref:hypothetical protein n=1 Tax=Saccharopolyspora pogona TaxID=333966 RepID=UPI001CC2527B|nr:hypothetical protein [Saccharopolyspora pogona]
MSFARTLLRVKPAEQLAEDGAHTQLRRPLGPVPLIALSVGAMSGTKARRR